MTLRCVACGHDNQPGPANCEKCGASLKGKGSIVTTAGQAGITPVRVVDFDIPFGQMIFLMIKWAVAAIPAAIIIGIVLAMVMGFFAAVGAGLR